MAIKHGFEIGEPCNRNGCTGTMKHYLDDGCHCLSTSVPPCAYCECDEVCCDECDWCTYNDDVVEVEPVKYPNTCFCGSKAWINFKEKFQCVNPKCVNYEGETK